MYTFKYKRHFFYKTIEAKGHNYSAEDDRMDVFLANDAGILSIPEWSKYTLKLDRDFILFSKKEIEDAVR